MNTLTQYEIGMINRVVKHLIEECICNGQLYTQVDVLDSLCYSTMALVLSHPDRPTVDEDEVINEINVRFQRERMKFLRATVTKDDLINDLYGSSDFNIESVPVKKEEQAA